MVFPTENICVQRLDTSLFIYYTKYSLNCLPCIVSMEPSLASENFVDS